MSLRAAFRWAAVVAVCGAAGAVAGVAITSPGGASPTRPDYFPGDWDGTISGLPDTIPVAGPTGPAGYITREQLIADLEGDTAELLEEHPPGSTYELPLMGPTKVGTFDVIGTKTCTSSELPGGGASQLCFEEHLDDNALVFPMPPGADPLNR